MMCDTSLTHTPNRPGIGRARPPDATPVADKNPLTCVNAESDNLIGKPPVRYDRVSPIRTSGRPRLHSVLCHVVTVDSITTCSPVRKAPRTRVASSVSGLRVKRSQSSRTSALRLQHRGQESAGIAVSNGSQILVFKDMGLVSQVFDETSLGSLQGHIAVGHARYSTTGASVWENAQPTFRATAHGSIALGHNGNLVNTAQLARWSPNCRTTTTAAPPGSRPPTTPTC